MAHLVTVFVAQLQGELVLLSGTSAPGSQVYFDNGLDAELTVASFAVPPGADPPANPWDPPASSFAVPAESTVIKTIGEEAAGDFHLQFTSGSEAIPPVRIVVGSSGEAQIAFVISSPNGVLLKRFLAGSDDLELQLHNTTAATVTVAVLGPGSSPISVELAANESATPLLFEPPAQGPFTVRVELTEVDEVAGQQDETGGTRQIEIIVEP